MAEEGLGNPMDKNKRDTGPFPVFDPAELTKIGNRNLQVASRAVRAYYTGATRLNREWLGFMSDRVKKDIETTTTLMTSKTSEQAFHVQAGFVEQALRDYADEASKVFHIAADLAKETLTPMEERAEEVLHYIDEHAGAKSKAAE